MYSVPLIDSVHCFCVNDRRKRLFENMWPLEQGVAYNSYLIVDQKTALIDTIEGGSASDYFDRIEELLQGRQLNYLIINHMEPDHSGEIFNVVQHFPGVQIVGNAQTFKILEGYWNVGDNRLLVSDGQTLDLGNHTLKFVLTPWVHWPETMMTYDQTHQILFTGDAFGGFGTLDGTVFDDEANFDFYEDEMRRYYSNIVGKYSNMVQKAFAKLEGVPVRAIAPTHGLIWRKNPQKVMELYNRWSLYQAQEGVVIVFASMYGNTQTMADYLARRVVEGGVRDVRVFDVSKTHVSHLINKVWQFNGLLLGSCAYNGQMFPLMEQLTNELQHLGVKNRHLGLFGSYSWSGGGVKNLMNYAQASGLHLVAEPVDMRGRPSHSKLSPLDALANSMVEAVKS